MKLREYQIDSIEQTRQAFRNGYRKVVLMLPTGSGKSIIARSIIESSLKLGKKVLFICDRKTLINQASEHFKGIPHGIVQSDNPMYQPWHDLQVATVQSLMRRPQVDADLIIVDECHVQWKHIKELMEKFNKVPFVGLTATPFSRGLGKMYQTLINPITTTELINMGFLVDPVVYAPATINIKGWKTQAGDFAMKDAEKKVGTAKITADIVNTYLDKGEKRKAILFPCNVAHSKQLINEFNIAGISSAHVDAHTPDHERDDIFSKLETGEIMMISSVGVLTAGFDCPSISCVILARPTKSLTLYIQMVGRGLRISEGKQDCIVLDHAGSTERLGWVTDDLPNELCDGKKSEAQRVKDEIEKKEEKEQLPKKCPQCDYLVEPKIFICPKCSFIFARKSDVKVQAGKLEKLTKKKQTAAEKRNKTISKEDKQAFYSAALSHCLKKNYKEGWAANKYRDYFSVYPNAMGKVAGGESMLFSSYLTSSNIRYAKSQSKLVNG